METQDVVVYVSSNCSECDRVTSWLNSYNVSFVEKNTTQNKAFMKELQNDNVYSTPAIFVKGDKILGFNRNKLMDALDLTY